MRPLTRAATSASAASRRTGQHDEIVEVDRRGAPQQMLVAAVDAAQPLLEEARGAGRVGLGIEQAALGVRDARQHRARRIGALRQPFVLERPLDQRDLVAVVEDHEPRLDAGALGVAPQHAEPEAVEGADEALGPRAGRGCRAHRAVRGARVIGSQGVVLTTPESRVDAIAHLGRRLVGEGDGDDPRRIDAPLLDQPADAVGDHPRLAGAGAGEHELRPVAVGDGGDLLRIEGLRRDPSGGDARTTRRIPVRASVTRPARAPAECSRPRPRWDPRAGRSARRCRPRRRD